MGAAGLSAREVPRTLLLIVVALALQLTVALDVQVAGAHPELMVGLAIAAGLAGGTQRGAIVGFFAGIAIDLFLPTPLGLTALVGVVIGAAAGRLVAAGVDRSHPLFVPGVAALGSAIGVIMFAVLGTVLGQPNMVTTAVGPAVGVVALVNGVLGSLFVRAFNWAFAQDGTGSAWRGSLVAGDRP